MNPRWIVGAICGSAAALHLYENAVLGSKGFSAGWFVWQMLPYLLVLLLMLVRPLAIAVIPAAVAVLVLDLITHYQVFIAPTSSTSALAIVWMPIWSTVLVVPIVTGISWAIIRIRNRARK